MERIFKTSRLLARDERELAFLGCREQNLGNSVRTKSQKPDAMQTHESIPEFHGALVRLSSPRDDVEITDHSGSDYPQDNMSQIVTSAESRSGAKRHEILLHSIENIVSLSTYRKSQYRDELTERASRLRLSDQSAAISPEGKSPD